MKDEGRGMKKIVWGVVLFGTLFFFCSLQAGLEDRPLNTDDAYTIKKGTWSTSLGEVFLRHDRDDRQFDIVIDIAHSFIENLEVGLQAPYTFLDPRDGDSEDGIGDITIRPEYQFLQEADNVPAVSGWVAVKTNTGSEDNGLGTGATHISFAGNLSKKFSGPAWFHINLGYTVTDSDSMDNVFFYKVAGEYLIRDRLKLVGEIVGQGNHDPDATDDPLEWLLGFIYEIPNGLILDFGFGTGLTDASPDIRVTGGVTYNF